MPLWSAVFKTECATFKCPVVPAQQLSVHAAELATLRTAQFCAVFAPVCSSISSAVIGPNLPAIGETFSSAEWHPQRAANRVPVYAA